MALLMQMGWFRSMYAKAALVQEICTLLTARKQLSAKLQDIESSIRRILRGFGLKVGIIGKASFEARVLELVAGQTMLERIAGAMLAVCAAPRAEYGVLHRKLLKQVRADAVG